MGALENRPNGHMRMLAVAAEAATARACLDAAVAASSRIRVPMLRRADLPLLLAH
jgi:hypothetical protein